MTACAPYTYDDVTPEAWARIKAAVKADYGFDVTVDYGEERRDDWAINWVYSAPNQTLTIQFMESPWWLTCAVIRASVDALVRPLL